MKIVYGVHGYGRGHAMRALAVLPELVKRHDVLLLAWGDSYEALRHDYPVVRIPGFRYHYTSAGKLSNLLTLRHNLSGFLDIKLAGQGVHLVMEAVKEFQPDLVLADSEAYSLAAGRRLGLPRIIFDHYGLLVHCRPIMSAWDRVQVAGSRWMYRRMFGRCERAIVTGFFEAPSVRPGVRVVGPVIRPEVRAVRPTRGPYLLVYVSMGQHEYTPQLEQALLALDCPVRVYGTSRRGLQGNLQFKPTANLPFIEDLAGCRAVLATCGNQLCGEVLYFGKPMLGMPIDCVEQRLNADYIERMGFGRRVRRGQVTAGLLRDFLAREAEYAGNAARQVRDGAQEAVEAIEQFAAELCPTSGAIRSTRTAEH